MSFGERNYKDSVLVTPIMVILCIAYSYNVNKVKPLNIMLPKTSTYVKSCDGYN